MEPDQPGGARTSDVWRSAIDERATARADLLASAESVSDLSTMVREVFEQVWSLAGAVAEVEEDVAATMDRVAAVRVVYPERAQAASRRAREYAARERREQARLRAVIDQWAIRTGAD